MSLCTDRFIPALLAGILGIGFYPVQAQAEGAARVGVFTVKAEKTRSTVSVGGTVIASRSVTLAAQLPGRVEFIAGKEGDGFEGGTQLLRLDDAELLAKRAAAQSQETAAASALRNAGVQLDREIASPSISSNTPGGMGMPSMMDQMMFNPMQSMMGMRQPGAERQAQVVNRQTQVDQARSSLLQAQASIKEIDAKLRDSVSEAPFSGVIVHKYVEVGDTVQPGQPLIDFADTSELQIQLDVPQRLRPGLAEGMRLDARLDSSADWIPVTVDRIFPVADTERHTVRVKLNLHKGTNADAGMYAEVAVPDPTARVSNRMVVPDAAVVWKGGLPLVFVLNEQNLTELRLIRVGDAVSETEVEVLSGLRGGERVVVNPRPGMGSGELVNPTPM
ncbi:MAG: efflux RND transporter periplasmic adaptor subunit [Chromatiales bacterium]|nr:efflux RND transporter periplasmic adaptor subunit [Chromatiales bacterium]